MTKLKAITSIASADIIGNSISAFFWFYMATLIEPAKYGEIHYFLGIAAIASVISLFGTQNTLIVYIAKNVKIQSTFYFISLIIGSISSLIIIFIFFRIDVAVVLLGYIINTLAIGDLLGRRLYNKYSKYVLIQKILTTVLGIGFFYVFGVEGIIFALALSYVAFTIRIYNGFRESKINFSLVRSRIGFITNNYTIGLISGFSGQIDKLIVAPLLGYVILGNYSLAGQVISILMIFTTILYKYLLPQDASGFQNKRLKKLTVVVSFGVTFFGILVLPLLIPQIFPKYSESVEAIQIMSLSVITSAVGMLYTSKFLAMEKSRFVLFSTLISLVTLVSGTIVLGGMFGIIGIATAHVLSSIFGVIFLIISNRHVKGSYVR